jgi:hypothetical protein
MVARSGCPEHRAVVPAVLQAVAEAEEAAAVAWAKVTEAAEMAAEVDQV